ncbi:hypothetical protein BUALT_Bualt04G0055000 [Buddleja alternifolia]|uniref:Protein kinase domain-containing protein n=1 Tax=Buddleja alternifolia TaxID=168488 RepID=A0AAV6XLK6_9LAMI|nr:hypothetical protein BUALT_Bualt04G0055000 [Buddleja alternifolia]
MHRPPAPPRPPPSVYHSLCKVIKQPIRCLPPPSPEENRIEDGEQVTFVTKVEELISSCPFTCTAYVYLKINGVNVKVRKATIEEIDKAPFLTWGDKKCKEDDIQKLFMNMNEPFLNLSTFKDFDTIDEGDSDDGKRKILQYLLPLRTCIFYEHYKMHDPSKSLSRILEDNDYLWESGRLEDKNVVNVVFLCATALVFEEREQSMFYQELLRYTNLFAIVEKFVDYHIREQPAIIDFSDVDVLQFQHFLQDRHVLGTPLTSSVYLCEFDNDTPLRLPEGSYAVKMFHLSDEEKEKGSPNQCFCMSELAYYRIFRHENFAQMIGYCLRPDMNFIVLK